MDKTINWREYKLRGIAYPTIFLSLFIFSTLILMFYHHKQIPYYLYLPIASILFFYNFTPLHESGHGLLAEKRYDIINTLFGWISAILYNTSFVGWQFIHTSHHYNVNDCELDPDKFYNNLTELLLFGWFLDYFYILYYLKHMYKLDLVKNITTIFVTLIYISIYILLIYNGYGKELLYYYYLPQRVGLFLASLLLDYGTHHVEIKSDKRIDQTYKLNGFTTINDYPYLLSIVCQNQNFHNIHHLYPMVPFYRYHLIWKKYKQLLLAKGTQQERLLRYLR